MEKLARQSLNLVILISFAKIFLKSWFVSATSTTNNKDIIDTIESICKRDPLAGKTVTGGIITINDSAWQISLQSIVSNV